MGIDTKNIPLQEHTVVFLMKQMVGVYQKARVSHLGLSQGILVHSRKLEEAQRGQLGTGEVARHPEGLGGSLVYEAGDSSKHVCPG